MNGTDLCRSTQLDYINCEYLYFDTNDRPRLKCIANLTDQIGFDNLNILCRMNDLQSDHTPVDLSDLLKKSCYLLYSLKLSNETDVSTETVINPFESTNNEGFHLILLLILLGLLFGVCYILGYCIGKCFNVDCTPDFSHFNNYDHYHCRRSTSPSTHVDTAYATTSFR